MNLRATPSLRIAQLVISNFRTFREPTEIPLSSRGVADEMPVFHGGNGAGKSTAIAALDLFFRASLCWMRSRTGYSYEPVRLQWDQRELRAGLRVSPRIWPPGVRSPLSIKVQFVEAKTPFEVELTPAGNEVFLRMHGVWAPGDPPVVDPPTALSPTDKGYLERIRNMFEAPFGVGSEALFILDARRHDFYFLNEGEAPLNAPASPLSSVLAYKLLALQTSLQPEDTERWRAFVALLGRFKTLQGREVSVVVVPGDQTIDLRFETRGRQILRISELSSGEQQVVALCAAVLTSRAAIVAIEEPEMSLHPDNQALVRDVLLEQVQRGLIDQIILESHVPTFDGPEVIRFSRSPEGVTSVERRAARADDALRERASAAGAEEQWVTPEGYTKLSEDMVQSLDLSSGGYLWFLRSEPRGRWEAWKADELDRRFGLKGEGSEE